MSASLNPSLARADGNQPAPGSCRVFAEGDDLYDAMVEQISQASETVLLESYIFAGDEIGWLLAEALAQRARSGVLVRVHLDAAGTLFAGTEELFGYLHQAGVEARWFNRWRWRDPLHYNRRNHRKLLVLDQSCVFVGGFNIHRESSRSIIGERRWRDVHVCVEGRLGSQAAGQFNDLWSGHVSGKAPPWDGQYRILPSTTGVCRRTLYCLYLDALTGARRSIDLATPYFVSDRRFREALASASERGVDVRILIPLRGDNRLARWAGHALARPLARRGVRFFEYLPRMLHSKLTLIDEQWTMLGSANADYRSFFINQELNLVSRAPVMCRQLKAVFMEDLAQSRAMDSSALKYRGLMGGLAKLLGKLLRRWL